MRGLEIWDESKKPNSSEVQPRNAVFDGSKRSRIYKIHEFRFWSGGD